MSVGVVALGAWCDVVPPEECSASPGGVSFVVHEFADLDDGRRVTLHTERGFTCWIGSPDDREGHDPWAHLTAESIETAVRTTVLPDEDQTGVKQLLQRDRHPEHLRAPLADR